VGCFLLGHQDALAYGVLRKTWQPFTTDMAAVSGQHPALFGWDLGGLGRSGRNLDGVPFGQMIHWMQAVHRRGGINTVSWHMDNLVSGGSSWDVHPQRSIKRLLPGGEAHQRLRQRLDAFTDFLRELRTGSGFRTPVPLIFRPFHEVTGHWFWWGSPHNSREDYVELWRFCWHYLHELRGVNHLLWAYSPDVFRNRAHYLKYYPGDAYVDILGLDDYYDLGAFGRISSLTRRLRILVELAEERGKIAALTETGREAVPRRQWYTRYLLAAIQADPVAARIKYVHLWRNHSPQHHYGPYPGHAANDDFRAFIGNPAVLSLADFRALV